MAYANGRIYLEADLEGCIASVSAADGRGLVRHYCGGTTRTPVVTGGVLYTAARGSSRSDPTVITASPISCTAVPCVRLWTAYLPGFLGSEIAVGRGRVYVPTVLNETPVLQVLDATSGRPLFSGAGLASDQVSGSTKVSVAADVAYLSFEHRQEVYAFPTGGCARSTCPPQNVLRLGPHSSGGTMSAVTVAEGTAAVAVSGTGIVALRTD